MLPALLAGEPTGNLGSTSGTSIVRFLRELNRARGTTVVLAPHAPELARAADHALTLRDGRIE